MIHFPLRACALILSPAKMTLVVLVALATGCAPVGSDRPGQAVRPAAQKAPPGAPSGTCWDIDISPAVIETLTRQEILQPPEFDGQGQITRPATVRTVTHQEIIRPRRETWFQTLCPADLSPDLVATLQRASIARKFHKGAITGSVDSATQAAILAYQQSEGLNSATLSLENARKLGLISVPR